MIDSGHPTAPDFGNDQILADLLICHHTTSTFPRVNRNLIILHPTFGLPLPVPIGADWHAPLFLRSRAHGFLGSGLSRRAIRKPIVEVTLYGRSFSRNTSGFPRIWGLGPETTIHTIQRLAFPTRLH